VLYAPGVYTGYGVKTMPGIREGLEQKRWAEAESQIARVAAVLEAESEGIEAAAELLEKASR
jgi:N-acetylated-alpha-linked acidic dipeptidase